MQEIYKEIDITDYLKVIIQRKKIIAGITGILIIAMILYTHVLATKHYQTDVLIQIGEVSGKLIFDVDQTKTQILTPQNAREILTTISEEDAKSVPITNLTTNALLKQIKVNPETNQGDDTPTNFFHIVYTNTHPEKSKEVVEILQEKVLALHKKEYDTLVKFRDTALKRKQTELAETIDNLQKAEKAIEQIYNSRYPSSYAEAQGQGFAKYLDMKSALQNKVETLTAEIEEIKLTSELKDRMSTVIISPQSPEEPMQALSLSTGGGIGLFSGIFIGVLVAFILEWWEKNKRKLYENF